MRQLQSCGSPERHKLDGRIDTPSSAPEPSVDLADVIGQSHARVAVEVAAAGAHHLMLTGPPEGGKRCWPTASGLASPAVAQRVAGGDGHSFGGRSAVGQHPSDHPAAVRGAASHVERGVAGRRRHRDGPAGRGQRSSPGSAVPRRVRRDRRERTGGAANSIGRRGDSACSPRRGGALAGAFQLVLAANLCPCAPADPRDCICAPMAKRR